MTMRKIDRFWVIVQPFSHPKRLALKFPKIMPEPCAGYEDVPL